MTGKKTIVVLSQRYIINESTVNKIDWHACRPLYQLFASIIRLIQARDSLDSGNEKAIVALLNPLFRVPFASTNSRQEIAIESSFLGHSNIYAFVQHAPGLLPPLNSNQEVGIVVYCDSSDAAVAKLQSISAASAESRSSVAGFKCDVERAQAFVRQFWYSATSWRESRDVTLVASVLLAGTSKVQYKMTHA